jgi:aryl-alcohol dehydrogenase-like predicted oxidoreductase
MGKTGLDVTELSLGTWGLSGDGYGPVSEAEQDRVIERAYALGIRLFETADSYAKGKMEERLGARLEGRADALIATKLGTDLEASPPQKRFEPDYLSQALERSLERLRRERIDIVLLHNPSSQVVKRGDATSLLKEWKQNGKLQAWGVSAGTLEAAKSALAAGAEVVSIGHNAFVPRPLKLLTPDLETTGAGVLAHSTLLYGLLCGQWASGKEFPDNDHRAERWTPDEFRRRIRQLNAMRPTAAAEKTTLRGVALRYVLENDKVASAVLGPRDTLQLDQLVREAGKKPPYLAAGSSGGLEGRLRTAGVEV